MSEPPRTLPEVTPLTRGFWCGGADGRLHVMRCQACGYWVHPPGPVCPRCLGPVAYEAVSGHGVVHTYSVNHQPWQPGLVVPYVVAIVELPEQRGLRLTTDVVGCAPGAVRIGLPVRVVFEQLEDVWLPLFEPVPGG